VIVTDLRQRCTVHRVIPGNYDTPRRGVRTTVFGEKRMKSSFDLENKTNSNKHTSTPRVKVENNELLDWRKKQLAELQTEQSRQTELKLRMGRSPLMVIRTGMELKLTSLRIPPMAMRMEMGLKSRKQL
jgi:hypothetical protein